MVPYMQREGFCGEDDPFDPHYLEDLITALGGTPVAYEARCQSVGSPSLLTNEKTALSMTASVLSEAKANGAQLVVSACTISHANLDSYQVKAGKVTGKIHPSLLFTSQNWLPLLLVISQTVLHNCELEP